MTQIQFPEFLDSLENTRYPFIPTATLRNQQVNFVEGTFLDAHLYAVAGTGRYYLSKVVVKADSVIVYVGDDKHQELLTGTIDLPVSNNIIALYDKHGRPGGVIVSEAVRLGTLAAWGLGEQVFDRAQTEFCVTCQMPVPDQGVSGIKLASGEVLSGKIWLVGEDGVIFRAEADTDKFNNPVLRLRVDVVGEPLFLQNLCSAESLFTPVNPIRGVRVVAGEELHESQPDSSGNFSIQMNNALTSKPALRIRTTDAGLVFTVEGSTPAT